MKYRNPVVSGMYPDPSICKAGNKYYMVCSSFQYFPAVPLLESGDLVNWRHIGHVLTRASQVDLTGAGANGGIYAPTIRCHEGRFYVVVTNVSHGGNFYVYTDDIHGPWSEPVWVEQDGIDPSLYFEDGRAYFMSNGTADDGTSGIVQCQIDIETGRKLTPSVCLWQATGGRFLEAPHLYRIGSYYYLLAAEGGTEYGHMCVYARSREMLGPYESYPRNPVLTNRDLGGYSLQGVGHGDLIRDGGGNYWMVHLAFRQLDNWVQHHITGREVCLVPVVFHEDGWFTAGENGTTRAEVETALIGGRQEFWKEYTFRNTEAGREWCFLRNPDLSQYAFSGDGFTLRGGSAGLSGSAPFPTFVGMRQKEMRMTVRCAVASEAEEACLCMYMQEDQHYEIGLRKEGHGYCLFRRLRVGDCEVVDRVIPIRGNTARLKIRADNLNYHFSAAVGGTEYPLGEARTKFLSTELAGNFTGVFTGLFAKNGDARFTDFSCVNEETYP